MSKEELLEALVEEHREGYSLFIGSEKANFILVASYNTPWVCTIHIFGKNKNGWEIVKAARKAVKYLLTEAGYHKLEMKAHVKSHIKLAERCGWSKEGEHPEAIKLEDGTFITEYSYGITHDFYK